MLDRLLQPRLRRPMEAIAEGLVRLNVSADGVTFAGFGFGIAGAVAIGFQLYWLGALLIVLNRLCDGLDGAVARLTRPSDAGGFLDITLDFLFYSAIPLGFAFADPQANALAAAFLIFSFVGTGTSFLAFAVMAAKRGIGDPVYPWKSMYFLAGLIEATETIAAFLIFCALPQYFPYLAVAFGGLCLISAGLRIHAGWRALRAS